MSKKVVLDQHNSSLNFIIEDSGYGGATLNYPLGFRFLWAGARANYGVCKGKVFYEVKIEENLDAEVDDDGDGGGKTKIHDNLVRLGWSRNYASFALGEDEGSYGYGGTGNVSNNKAFSRYGKWFGKGDVIGAMMDLSSSPASISFMKNGENLGEAVSLPQYQAGKTKRALYPHVFCKNCRVKLNFGQQEPWFPPPKGYTYIDKVSDKDKISGIQPPSQKSDCEVLVMIGLPGSGKTTWARNLVRKEPEKCYNVLGADKTLQELRVASVTRVYADRMEMLEEIVSECVDTLLGIAASRNRNYIIDQGNLTVPERKKILAAFKDFVKVGVIMQPEEAEYVSRCKKREETLKKVTPFTEIRRMKANYKLPREGDGSFDRVEYPELPQEEAENIVSRYNSENAQYKT